jgi:putative transposase
MLAEETRNGLSRLGIEHKTTLPYSPYPSVAHKNMWPSAQIEA